VKESKARKNKTEHISPHFYILQEESPHSGQQAVIRGITQHNEVPIVTEVSISKLPVFQQFQEYVVSEDKTLS
jgi:hypothetical protein